MNDFDLRELIEAIVANVEERFGRLAAWVGAAVLMLALPAIIVLVAVWWFSRHLP